MLCGGMVVKQNLLFGNLPQLDVSAARKRDEKIVKRVSSQRRSAGSSGTLIRVPTSATDRAKKSLIARVMAAVELARKNLQHEDWMECVQDVDRFREYMRKACSAAHVAVDTETTGLDPIDDKLVGLALYFRGEKSIYVPIRHTDFDDSPLPGQIPIEVVREELERLRQSGARLIYHNAKFDIRVIKNQVGVTLPVYWCTNLASNFLNENESHKLKHLYDKYILRGQGESATFSDLFEGVPFSYVPIDIAYLYACRDPRYTLELFEFQEPYLTPGHPKCVESDLEDAAVLMRETEFRLIPHLAEMEDRGISFSIQRANQLVEQYKTEMKEALQRCYDYIRQNCDFSQLPADKRSKLKPEGDGGPMNIGSPTQLAILIYDLWKLKSPDKEKPRGTGEEILLYLAKNSKHGEFFKDILAYRSAKKMLTTYVEKLPSVCKEVVRDESGQPIWGVIHCNFHQYGAKTGRFSSSDPNLQNIPRDSTVRSAFVARPGYYLISGDYSQQEPRVLADRSGDEQMKRAYAENRDLYSQVASVVYSLPYEECLEFYPDGTKNPEGKRRRQEMKSVVLGLMYGRGAQAIAEQLGITREEAQGIINRFFGAFPKVKAWIEETHRSAQETGYVKTARGRKRRLPDIQLPDYEYTLEQIYDADGDPLPMPSPEEAEAIFNSYLVRLRKTWSAAKRNELRQEALERYGIRIIDNGGKIAEAERQAVNSIIQGTSADITKEAMLAAAEDPILRELGFHMLLTIHDEILGEAPKENALAAAKRLTEVMLYATEGWISVPMKVDVEVTEYWGGPDLRHQLEVATN